MSSRRETIKHTCPACNQERRIQFNDRMVEAGERTVTCGRPIGDGQHCHARTKFELQDGKWVSAGTRI